MLTKTVNIVHATKKKNARNVTTRKAIHRTPDGDDAQMELKFEVMSLRVEVEVLRIEVEVTEPCN